MSVTPFNGARPVFGARVYIHETAVIIGNVVTGDDVSFWPGVVVRGDVNDIRIGDRTNIQDGSVLHVTHDGPYTPGGRELVIGNDVTTGHRVVLHACTVGDRCLIGTGAIVLDDVVIEPDVLLAAGSLVPPGKTLKSGCLYRGQPARLARELTQTEIDQNLYTASHYVKMKQLYLDPRTRQ